MYSVGAIKDSAPVRDLRWRWPGPKDLSRKVVPGLIHLTGSMRCSMASVCFSFYFLDIDYGTGWGLILRPWLFFLIGIHREGIARLKSVIYTIIGLPTQRLVPPWSAGQ